MRQSETRLIVFESRSGDYPVARMRRLQQEER